MSNHDAVRCPPLVRAPLSADQAGPLAATSHHLRVLREAGVIDWERRGTRVHYRLVPGVLARLATVLDGEPATVGAAP